MPSTLYSGTGFPVQLIPIYKLTNHDLPGVIYFPRYFTHHEMKRGHVNIKGDGGYTFPGLKLITNNYHIKSDGGYTFLGLK